MATFYGPWVATDDFRAVLDVTVSNTSATQCTVSVTLKVQSIYGVVNTTGHASATVSGSTYSTDGFGWSTNSTKTVLTHSWTVARGSSSKSIKVSGRVWATGVSAYTKGSTASGSVTIPAIDYDSPNAPSSCSATRASDTQAKVAWKNGSTSTTRPRSSTKVERQTDGGSWVQVASVGASVASYTDNGIGANHRYRYRVRAYGSGGYSSYATSGYIYTTPAAPRSVSVAVATGTTCTVDVDGSNAPYAQEWEVQSQLNGGDWQVVGTYSTFPQTVDLGGGTVAVRARAKRGSLASAWKASATITTICPPLAPTVALDPSGVVPTFAEVAVTWVPNHPDGSAQTAAQVEYAVGTGSPVTADVTGAATSYELPDAALSGPATVSVRVRTHGADEDWGAWSEPTALTVAEPPLVAITSPASDGATVTDLPLVVTWEADDQTGVASQQLTLLDADGTALHTARLDGAARSYTLDASTYLLSNLTNYSLRLTVTGGSTLQEIATRDFATEWTPPAEPVVAYEVDGEGLSVELTVSAGEGSDGVPPTVSLTVQRVNAEGSMWTVGDGLAGGETVIDRLPPINEVTDYVVTAHSEAGATSETRVSVAVLSTGWAYNFGVDASRCVLLSDDQKWSASPRRSYELYDFADGGENGGLPVAYEAEVLSCSGSQSFSLLDEPDKARELWEIAREMSVVGWVRSPFGTRQRAAIEIDLSGDVTPGLVSVSVSTSEVAFEEARVG